MRINVGINPRYLTDEHLLAEQREIMMIPTFLKRAIKSGSINNIPKELNLGKGYATFFLDKLEYIESRYFNVTMECIRRGFKINYRIQELRDLKNEYPECNGGFIVVELREADLLTNRIKERIINSTKPYFHYRGKRISKEDAISMLDDNREAFIERWKL